MTNMIDTSGTNKFTWTAGNQLLTEDGPFASDTVTNSYVNRLRTALALGQPSAASWTNGFSYDAARRLTTVISPAGTSSYAYTNVGAGPSSGLLIRKLTLPNSAYITNFYDSVARLVTNTLKNSSGTVLDKYAYIYNPANQRTNITRADSSYYGFRYDKIGQLTVADSTVNTEDRGYLYDAAWNLNDRTNNGVVSAFTVDVDNQLTTEAGLNCTYDANGNLTQVGDRFGMSTVNYVYDDENRLVEVYTNSAPAGPTGGGGPWDSLFTYDGLGRLRQRQEYVNGGLTATIEYVYDGNRVIEERDGNNNPTVAYTRGSDLSGTLEGAGGIGGLLARSDQFSFGNFTRHNYYFADGNGNITYMTAANQGAVASYRYDPFGNTISFNGILASVNLYRFSSKEIHANSGMYYYLYRFYDPNLQRWINRDPIQELGGVNLYELAWNDPTDLIDLFGLIGNAIPSVVFAPPAQPPLPPEQYTDTSTEFWNDSSGYISCYSKCMGLDLGIKGAEAAGVNKAIARSYYTSKYPKWFRAGGRYSKVLVPKLAGRVSGALAAVSICEAAHCMDKCLKETNTADPDDNSTPLGPWDYSGGNVNAPPPLTLRN